MLAANKIFVGNQISRYLNSLTAPAGINDTVLARCQSYIIIPVVQSYLS